MPIFVHAYIKEVCIEILLIVWLTLITEKTKIKLFPLQMCWWKKKRNDICNPLPLNVFHEHKNKNIFWFIFVWKGIHACNIVQLKKENVVWYINLKIHSINFQNFRIRHRNKIIIFKKIIHRKHTKKSYEILVYFYIKGKPHNESK